MSAPQEAIDAALAQRMADLIRDLHADHVKYEMHDRVQDFVARTAAIIADLPKPVAPAVLACREIVAVENEADRSSTQAWARQVREGNRDSHVEMKIALAAYNAGRDSQ